MAKFATHASGAIWWIILQLMQVTQPGGPICNQCMWFNLLAKLGTNASGAILWTILQLMQIAPSGDQIWNQALHVGQIWSQYEWHSI